MEHMMKGMPKFEDMHKKRMMMNEKEMGKMMSGMMGKEMNGEKKMGKKMKGKK